MEKLLIAFHRSAAKSADEVKIRQIESVTQVQSNWSAQLFVPTSRYWCSAMLSFGLCHMDLFCLWMCNVKLSEHNGPFFRCSLVGLWKQETVHNDSPFLWFVLYFCCVTSCVFCLSNWAQPAPEDRTPMVSSEISYIMIYIYGCKTAG